MEKAEMVKSKTLCLFWAPRSVLNPFTLWGGKAAPICHMTHQDRELYPCKRTYAASHLSAG